MNNRSTALVMPSGTTGARMGRYGFFVILAGLIGSLYVASPFLLVILGWWQEPFSDLGGAERVSHRVHEVLFGVIFAQAMAGAVSQLRRAREWPAGMWQTMLTLAGFVVTLGFIGRREPLGIIFLSLSVMAMFLHPAGKSLWRTWRPHPLLLVVAALGVPPWLTLAADNLVKAGNQAADHVTHWGGVAAFAVIQILLSLLASVRPPGYRLVAGSVGAAGVLYVLASALFGFDASAKPGAFAFWLLLWAITWLTVAFRSGEGLAGLLQIVGAVAASLIVLGLGGPLVGSVIGLALAAFLLLKLRASKLPRLVQRGLGAVGLLVLVGGMAVAIEAEETNIPHGLSVDYAQADASTCLECHTTGVNGATLIPHEVTRTCDGSEFCWDGRTDCMGCHRYDPALRQEALLPSPPSRQIAFVGGLPLAPEDVASLLAHVP